MKTCEPGCEFMLHGKCNLYEEHLTYIKIENGKVAFLRCFKCEDEKNELEVIQDLEELENACERISEFTEIEKRERLLEQVDGR